MRTEEWTQEHSGMLSTGLVDVFEAGDVVERVRKDTVMLDRTVFEELATAAGWTLHAGT